MATSKAFIDFVYEQVQHVGHVRYQKMFGEYMVYVNDKPLLLVCDDTVFVKIHPSLQELMKDADQGFPYEGAKAHYILDIDHVQLCSQVIKTLEPHIQVPKSRRKHDT